MTSAGLTAGSGDSIYGAIYKQTSDKLKSQWTWHATPAWWAKGSRFVPPSREATDGLPRSHCQTNLFRFLEREQRTTPDFRHVFFEVLPLDFCLRPIQVPEKVTSWPATTSRAADGELRGGSPFARTHAGGGASERLSCVLVRLND